MNKKELIQEVAIRSGMSQADVERVLNHITDTVRDSLHNEESVTLVGFGSFRYRNVRHARGIIRQPVRKCRFPQRRLLNSDRVRRWKFKHDFI